MTTAPTARAPRPSRPPAPALPEFDTLDQTHREALQMLQAFDELLAHLHDNGPDETAQASAQRIMAFFAGPGRTHHAEEERHVFPALLSSTDVEMVQHVRRLQQDHGWLEEDWRELAPQVEAIAKGYNWYDLAMLRLALPVFTALYNEHIALEESLIYPEAKRRRLAELHGRDTQG
ncbi:MAG TPA: hemerythrin domain-containing protein [Rubrivivax sp.]|nr:hemerythrin domain-containing protein [Rubrivivax sp.]